MMMLMIVVGDAAADDDDIIIVFITVIRVIIFHRCLTIDALVYEETVARLIHESWIMIMRAIIE